MSSVGSPIVLPAGPIDSFLEAAEGAGLGPSNEDEGSDDFSIEEELDPLYNKALSLIKKERRVSTSFLQRHFAIGYNRAARIVDTFEKKGIVSSANSMGRREVLINE